MQLISIEKIEIVVKYNDKWSHNEFDYATLVGTTTLLSGVSSNNESS